MRLNILGIAGGEKYLEKGIFFKVLENHAVYSLIVFHSLRWIYMEYMVAISTP